MGKIAAALFTPVALIAQLFSPLTSKTTQDVLAASYTVSFGNLRSNRYNSAFKYNNGRNMKVYTNRMFTIHVDGQKAFCVEPLAPLVNGTYSGEKVSLESVLRDTGLFSNAKNAEKRMSLFAYYTDHPTSKIRAVENQYNISSNDKFVATQYYIWELAGAQWVDGTGLVNSNDNGLGLTYVQGTDYRTVTEYNTSMRFNLTSIDYRVDDLGMLEQVGDVVNHGERLSSTTTRNSANAYSVEFHKNRLIEILKGRGEWDSSSGDIFTYYTLEPIGSPSVTTRTFTEGIGYTTAVYSKPAWYREYSRVIKEEVEFQMKLTAPTFDSTKKTGVVNQPIKFSRTGGSSLANFFRDSGLPTSRPSSPNYGGHTYVWYSGNDLYVQGTTRSPDGFFRINLHSNRSAGGSAAQGIRWASSSRQKLAVGLNGMLGELRLGIDVQILKYGDLEITKTTDQLNYDRVQGTRFGVYKTYKDGKVSDPITENAVTDVNGVAKVKDIMAVGPAPDYKIGVTYYVKELSVPEPWILDENVYPVVIRPNETTRYTSKNSPAYGQIAFTKQDSETGSVAQGEATLVGAEFRVTLISSKFFPNLVGHTETVTIGKDLTAKTSDKLPLGVYSVTEVKAPTGYRFKEDIPNVEIKHKGQTVPVVLEQKTVADDVIKGRISVTKTDAETGDLLRNAKFELRRNFANGDKRVVDVITTNDKGIAVSGYHPYGNYQLVEITAPYGYTENIDDRSKDVHDVFIDSHDKTYTISQTNPYQYGGIEIHKQNAFEPFFDWTNEEITLAGAEYEIRAVNMFVDRTNPNKDSQGRRNGPYHYDKGALVTKLVTDKNGYAKTGNILPLGVYDLVEVKSPEGYVVNNVAVRFTVEYDGQTVKYTKNNEQNSYNSQTLVDYYNNLQDTLYNVVIPNNSPLDLDNLSQVKPKPGALKNSSIDNSRIVTTNERPRLGRIEVKKMMEDFDQTQGGQSGHLKPEKGVKFEIRNHRGEVVDTIVTNSSGWGTSNWLPYGKYTVKQHTLNEELGDVETFTVHVAKDKDLEVHQFEMKNTVTPYRVRLIKVDAETGKTIPIRGVSFRIYEEKTGGKPIVMNEIIDGKFYKVNTFKTNDDGEIILPEEIPYGVYYLEEIEGPDGYYLDPNAGRFAIEVKGSYTDVLLRLKEFEVPNTPQKGVIQISKKGEILKGLDWKKLPEDIVNKIYPDGVDGSDGDKLTEYLEPRFENDYLEGAVFELRAAEDIVGKEGTVHYVKGQLVETIVTGPKDVGGEYKGNGVSKELPLGKYSLKEIKAPKGYMLDDTVHEFTLKPDKPSIRVDIQSHHQENIKQQAKFKFVKNIEQSDWFDSHKNAEERIVFGLFNKKEIEYQGFKIPANTLLGYSDLNKDLEGSFDTMLAGDYYIKELSTSEEYILDETQHDVTFTYDSEGQPEVVIEYDKVIDNELKRFKFKIEKVDSETSEAIFDTVFKLYALGSRGEKVLIDEYSTDENGFILIEDLEYGSYYLEEVKPSKGYWTGENPGQTIVVNGEHNDTIYYQKENVKNTISFLKVDGETGETVEGATLRLIDKDGNTVDEWVTTDTYHVMEGKLQVGDTYTLREIKTPAGYVTAEDVVFVMENEKEVSIEMIDYPTTTEISKVDITNGKELPGAHMSVRDEDGNIIEEWISTDKPHIIKYLEVGKKYILREDLAPIGFATAEEIEFVLKDDHTVQSVVMYDKPLTVEISKWDITNDKELPGATLQIIDEKGNVVYEWVSTDKPHVIKNIPQGKYILRETIVPDGYVTSVEDIEFEIIDTELVQKVQMKNEMIKTTISKQDITNGKELSGAHLTVLDDKGNVVESWVSSDTPHEILGLVAGKTYTLREDLTPIGYVTASEIQFTIDGSGVVNTVAMIDDVTKVELSKKDITTGEELPGATLQIIDKDGNIIHEWVSTDKPHYIEKLPVGKYTLREITAPNGYVTAEDVEFEITDSGIVHKVVMKDDVTKVEIYKVDQNGKPVAGAKLQILDLQGNVIEEWISTNKPHYIEKLPVGNYILREVEAPQGYELGKDVAFEIKDTAEVQKVEMVNIKKTIQTGDVSEGSARTTEVVASNVQSNKLSMTLIGLASLIGVASLRKKDE